MSAQKVTLEDYNLEYISDTHVTVRTKDDGCTTLGQADWANRQIQAVVLEIPLGDIRSAMHTGLARTYILHGDKVLVMHESDAEDMWHDYKEAQFDEFVYKEELEELFEEILDRIDDGIRERLDDDKVDPATLKAWAAKWKAMLEDMNDKANQDDGVYDGPVTVGGHVDET